MRTGGVRDGEEEDGCGERRAGATSEVQGRTGRGARCSERVRKEDARTRTAVSNVTHM